MECSLQEAGALGFVGGKTEAPSLTALSQRSTPVWAPAHISDLRPEVCLLPGHAAGSRGPSPREPRQGRARCPRTWCLLSLGHPRAPTLPGPARRPRRCLLPPSLPPSLPSPPGLAELERGGAVRGRGTGPSVAGEKRQSPRPASSRWSGAASPRRRGGPGGAARPGGGCAGRGQGWEPAARVSRAWRPSSQPAPLPGTAGPPPADKSREVAAGSPSLPRARRGRSDGPGSLAARGPGAPPLRAGRSGAGPFSEEREGATKWNPWGFSGFSWRKARICCSVSVEGAWDPATAQVGSARPCPRRPRLPARAPLGPGWPRFLAVLPGASASPAPRTGGRDGPGAVRGADPAGHPPHRVPVNLAAPTPGSTPPSASPPAGFPTRPPLPEAWPAPHPVLNPAWSPHPHRTPTCVLCPHRDSYVTHDPHYCSLSHLQPTQVLFLRMGPLYFPSHLEPSTVASITISPCMWPAWG